jgi:hypothetical protein
MRVLEGGAIEQIAAAPAALLRRDPASSVARRVRRGRS